MKGNRPDYSGHEAELGLLSQIFPQLRPLAKFFGTGKEKTGRSGALFAIVMQFLQALAAATGFMAAIILISKLEPYLPFLNSNRGNLLTRLAGAFIGLPAMMIILLSLSNSFDLFYLLITGNNFDKCGDELKPVKSLMLVLGFVGSMAAALIGYFYFETYVSKLQKKRQMRIEQQEYFSHLNQGRAAWNRYITEGSMHRIEFSEADLSKRHFKGFYFYSVDFIGTDLTDTIFEDCYLGYSKFSGAILKNTVFKDSYLKGADFIGTDLSGADLTGAFGEKIDFKKALNAEKEIAKLRPCKESRWNGVSWFDFRDEKWLKEKGYWTEGRKPLGLEF